MSAHLETTWQPPGVPGVGAHLAHLATGPPGGRFSSNSNAISIPHLALWSPPGGRATWHETFWAGLSSRALGQQQIQVNILPPGGRATWRTWRERHLASTWPVPHLALRPHLATWPTWLASPPGVQRATWRKLHLALPPGAKLHLARLATWRAVGTGIPTNFNLGGFDTIIAPSAYIHSLIA